MVSEVSINNFVNDVTLLVRDGFKAYIADPLGRSTGFVMTEFPGLPVRYPVITVKFEPASTSFQGFKSNDVFVSLRCTIKVFSKSTRQRDELADKVLYITTFFRLTLALAPWYLHDFSLVNAFNEDEPGKGGEHNKVIELIFNFYRQSS
jgi:hypothetical protein